MRKLTVQTRVTEELIDITSLVERAAVEEGARDGVCLVFSPHTTAGITINESADPAVAEDLCEALGRIVPENVRWKHLEGNSPAHLKASLIGSSVLIGLEEGKLALGTWQGIFFCEFDGPRTRRVWVAVFR